MNISVPPAAFFLPEPKGENSGVDFLGLRQTNLDLMADLVPGINNVTAYIRPFSLLAWIFWKFHGLCIEAGIGEAKESDLRVFRERIEILFTWGARQADYPRIPGKSAEPPLADGKGRVRLTFDEWKRVEASTSLIAALWYGPASKAVSGLELLMPVIGKSGFFRTVGIGVVLAEALDKKLRLDSERYQRLLHTLGSVEASASDAAALWLLWGPDAVTLEEQEAFRSTLYNEDEAGDYHSMVGRRSSTLALARLHLSECGCVQSVEEVRKGMFLSQRPDGRVYSVPPALGEARDKWVSMQVRQLQRLALETLLSWVECKIIGGVHDTAPMVKDFAKVWDDSAYPFGAGDCLGEVLGEMDQKFGTIEKFVAACREGSAQAPLALMDAIQDSFAEDDRQYPAHCLYALLLCAAFARCLGPEAPALRVGGPGRIPFYYLRSRLEGIRDLTMREAMSYILEAMVISQHFSTAVSRFDGRNQRLRLAIEESGLVPLVGDPWEPTVTEDRLPTLLSLAAECGLIARGNEEGFLILG